jgi:hypothetical protein
MNPDLTPSLSISQGDQLPRKSGFSIIRKLFFILSILFFLGVLLFLVYYNGKSIYDHGI